MSDQASALRQIVQNIKSQRTRTPGDGARIVAVTSGKGGVGKTSITVNLAIALSRKGLRVLVIDCDFGLSNVDVLMGTTAPFDLSHVVHFQKDIREVIAEGPNGVRFIAGGSGVQELLNLNEAQLARLVDNLVQLENTADVILLDTGAGISSGVLRVLMAAQEVIVVTSPEPTSMMDAYALIKTLSSAGGENKMRLVVNRAETTTEAEETLTKFASVVRLYLRLEMEELGYVLFDQQVSRAVKAQTPFIIGYPKSTAARNIENIAWKLLDIKPETTGSGFKGFLQNLVKRR
jgi:flagellar biosynthesis protein FlhG